MATMAAIASVTSPITDTSPIIFVPEVIILSFNFAIYLPVTFSDEGLVIACPLLVKFAHLSFLLSILDGA